MDDNFLAIVAACKWGRNVYDNIQRFLQFQLSVNFVALTVAFTGAAVMKQSPLNAIQLLWVNLIMDSLAALALATETPKPDLLKRKPQIRDDYLVSRKMVKHIMYMSIWQSIILLIFAIWGEFLIVEPDVLLRYDRNDIPYVYPGRLLDWDQETPLYSKWIDSNGVIGAAKMPGGDSRHFTFFFALFVLFQITNMVCSRKIHDEVNIFAGICDNAIFVIVWLLICGLQVFLVQCAGFVFEVNREGLAWEQWLMCVILSLTIMIINFIVKFIPDRFTPSMGKDEVFNAREIAANRPPGRTK